MRNITSVFRGVTINQRDLMTKVHELGWQLDKIDIKPDGYVVKLKNENKEKLEFKAQTVETALAQALRHIANLHLIRNSAWKNVWTHQLKPIAIAYAKAPIFDHKAAIGWKALADDAIARRPYIEDQIQVEYTHHPAPYNSGAEMAKDVNRGKIKIPLNDLDHPIWTEDQVLAHRLSHAILGQAPSSSGHDWASTNIAVANHAPYLSSEAQKALFSEHIGRGAFRTYFGTNSPSKIAYLKDFMGNQNDVGHSGESPKDTLAPKPLT